jgi:hypothetical protein
MRPSYMPEQVDAAQGEAKPRARVSKEALATQLKLDAGIISRHIIISRHATQSYS